MNGLLSKQGRTASTNAQRCEVDTYLLQLTAISIVNFASGYSQFLAALWFRGVALCFAATIRALLKVLGKTFVMVKTLHRQGQESKH